MFPSWSVWTAAIVFNEVIQPEGQSFTEQKGNHSSPSTPGEKLLCQDYSSLSDKLSARNSAPSKIRQWGAAEWPELKPWRWTSTLLRDQLSSDCVDVTHSVFQRLPGPALKGALRAQWRNLWLSPAKNSPHQSSWEQALPLLPEWAPCSFPFPTRTGNSTLLRDSTGKHRLKHFSAIHPTVRI